MTRSDLQRFSDAQNPIWETVLEELRAGAKRTHWMWFVFPQIAGLGRSETAQYYALNSIDEVIQYLSHPILTPRLVECCVILNNHRDKSAVDIFGEVDAMKLHSSLTLFDHFHNIKVFDDCLRRYYNGRRCEGTLSRYEKSSYQDRIGYLLRHVR